MSSKARREIYTALEDAQEAYTEEKTDFNAGYYQGLKVALGILDEHESTERDFLSEALNSGDGVYRP